MTSPVQVVRIAIRNVGIHSQHLELGDFSPRLNVISGGNEVGKSTIIAGLRAALLERHDAKHAGIKALQPYHSQAAPEVWVEFTLGDERFHVYKRFLEKPRAELRAYKDGQVLRQGSDFDQFLWERLGSHPPGQKGPKPGDLGIWGLLWVAQDETAYLDPGSFLDKESKDNKTQKEYLDRLAGIRGELQDAISRQIGQITGGRHSERVRARVQEHLTTYLTGDRKQPTGDYRRAIEAKEAAEARVREIEAKVREVEDLSQHCRDKAERLAALERQRAQLDAQCRAANEALKEAELLDAQARRAQAELSEAEARLATVTQKHEARTLLVADEARLRQQAACHRADIAQLDPILEQQCTSLAEAQEAAQRAMRQLDDLRHEITQLTLKQEYVRRAEQVRDSEQRLARAKEIQSELGQARERIQRGLDSLRYERLRELDASVRQARQAIEATGTRLNVTNADGVRTVFLIPLRLQTTIPGIGEVEIEAAKPGLAAAAKKAAEALARLQSALTENGVTDLQKAREQRAEAKENEAEAKVLRRRLTELDAATPSDLESLALRAQARISERDRVAFAMEQAQAAAQEIAGIERKLAEIPLDEEAYEELRAAQSRLLTAQGAHEQIGTLLSVKAQKPTRVQVGSEPAQMLNAGDEIPAQALTASTKILIDDRVTLTLEPRGEDLAKSRTRLERCTDEVKRLLERLDVPDYESAEQRAAERSALVARRDAGQNRLAALAPAGLAALEAEAAQAAAAAHQSEHDLTSARQIDSRLRVLEARLSGARVTDQAIKRLEKFQADCQACQSERERCSARLSARSGQLAAALGAQPLCISERTHGKLPSDVSWEFVPGEAEGGHELLAKEQSLDAALARLGVSTFEEATARWSATLQAEQNTEQLRARLGEVIPEGIEALQAALAEHQTRLASLSVQPEELLSEKELTALLQEKQGQQSAVARQQGDADRLLNARRNECSQTEIQLNYLRSQVESADAEAKLLRTRWESEEAAEPSETLQTRCKEAQKRLRLAEQADEEAASALDNADPDGLREEKERADAAIGDWEKRRNELHTEGSKLQGALERAAAEGRFEDLTLARVALAAANAEHARLHREALAARRLAEVVQQAYEESRQTFLGPVLRESAPYIRQLRPGSELVLSESLSLQGVTRAGMEEDFSRLSGGTREQLAVVVRLALARVLAKDKRPLPLILDDPMGWTDSARFNSMMRILRDASKEFQVVILTCHPDRFLPIHADATFDVEKLKGAAA